MKDYESFRKEFKPIADKEGITEAELFELFRSLDYLSDGRINI